MSLEAAKLLKAAGYPQDQWPQMVWRESTMDMARGIQFAVDWRGVWPSVGEWYAAPDALDALMWLETAKGIAWAYDPSDNPSWGFGEVAQSYRHVGSNPVEVPQYYQHGDADTPDALIIQICGRLTAMGARTAAAVVALE